MLGHTSPLPVRTNDMSLSADNQERLFAGWMAEKSVFISEEEQRITLHNVQTSFTTHQNFNPAGTPDCFLRGKAAGTLN